MYAANLNMVADYYIWTNYQIFLVAERFAATVCVCVLVVWWGPYKAVFEWSSFHSDLLAHKACVRKGDYSAITSWLPWSTVIKRGVEDELTEKQVPSSSYNHDTLTTCRTSVKESLQMLLQSCSKQLPSSWCKQVIPSQMFWELSVCCGRKMNWAAAFQVALCNLSQWTSHSLSASL